LHIKVALIDNYDSYTFNLYQVIWTITGVAPDVYRNDEISADALLERSYTHFVISPGPGDPSVHSDFGACSELITKSDRPTLGVCLGHQGLAVAFGGAVGKAPYVAHGRTARIHHDGVGLFAGVPQRFAAVRYHSLIVAEPLPKDLVVTARSEDGLVMGIRHREKPLYGVQFHPESIETSNGHTLIRNFLGSADAAPLFEAATERAATPGDLLAQPHEFVLKTTLSPEQMFVGLHAGDELSFWLDSSDTRPGAGRYSFIGGSSTSHLDVIRGHPSDEAAVRRHATTFFEGLAARLAEAPRHRSSLPFTGGYVGYVGYGMKSEVGVGTTKPGHGPEAEMIWVERFLAYDHEADRWSAVAINCTAEEAARWLLTLTAQIAALPSEFPEPRVVKLSVSVRSSVSDETYRRHFEAIQTWLEEGNTYEACYTYQLHADSDAPPLDVYRRLRRINPAPYASYLRLGDRHVLCASPERFLKLDVDGWAETKPIKGTLRREALPGDDANAAMTLASDAKTRSENLMIVDLLRNDLGRVCEPGSVTVPKLMHVETYATVHQLVSTVRGRLRDGLTAVDALTALFPGGSMTGAPKVRTVSLLDGIESEPRGIYSGCLGYLSTSGSADLNIVIRSLVWDGTHVRIGVGGAITAMSDCGDELAETRLKAAASLAALGADHEVPRSVPLAASSAPSRPRSRACHSSSSEDILHHQRDSETA